MEHTNNNGLSAADQIAFAEGTTASNLQRPANYTQQERSKIIQMVQHLGNGSESVDGIEDVEDLIVLVTSNGSTAIDEMMLKFKSMHAKTKHAKWNDTRGKKKGKKKQQRARSKLPTVTADVGKAAPMSETISSCLYSHFFNTLGEWIFMTPKTPNPDEVVTTDPSAEVGNQIQVSGIDVRRALNERVKGEGATNGGNMAMRTGTAATEGSSKVAPDAAEQHSLQIWLRIAGIHETDSENTKEIVLTMAAAVNAGIESDDIIQATRHSKAKLNTAQPREIYVNFTTETARQKFYDATRSNQLRHLADYKNVYVNDVLTQERQNLFNKAWFLKKENRVNQVWSDKGEIYVKDNDLNVHHIVDHRDIDDLLKGTKGGGATNGASAAGDTSRVAPDAAEQHSLRIWLRIAGIQETNGENTKEIVLTMAAAVNADIESKDIIQATRHSAKHYAARSREIYVKFTTEPARQKFYNAAIRRLRHLADYKNVYVNDVLTQERQKLMKRGFLKRKTRLSKSGQVRVKYM